MSSYENGDKNFYPKSMPNICGLLGNNPSRLSQKMHQSGFDSLGLDYCYHSFKVNSLNAPIDAMRKMGFRGYSVTIPFKEEVMALLDDIDEVAHSIGAVNTIINTDGSLVGYNTDYIGVRDAIKELGDRVLKNALVIGSGGAAKGGIKGLQALGIKKIDVCNRTLERAHELCSKFSIKEVHSLDSLPDIIGLYDLVLNATPIDPFSNLEANHIGNHQIIFDMILSETDLLKKAKQADATTIYGIRMLLHQGLEQFRLFTGKEPPVKAMEAALLKEFG